MKKALLTSALLAAGVATQVSAQVWSENFNSGIPSTWTMINVDGKTPNSADFNTRIVNTLGGANGKAWMCWPRATGDSTLLTVSDFSPAGQADRWLITPSFQVTSANMFLLWEDAVASTNYPDSMQILVSPTAGTTTGSFTTTLYNMAGGAGYTTHAVNLGSYNGTTIRIAFRNHSTDQYVLFMDNPQTMVLPNADLALTSISPVFPGIKTVGAVGTNFTIKGNVKNLGANTVTSYTVKYQQGSNPVVSETKTANIPAYGTASFSFNTPYNLAAAGKYPVKVWVELTGDNNHANDTANTAFASTPSTNVTKKLLFEEGTGTWCGWCVRGLVFMDSFRQVNGGMAAQVAVHNQDPMMVSAYDALVTSTPGFTGFPGMAIDRRETVDPSNIFSSYNSEKNYYGFADISFGTPSVSGNTVTVNANITPGIELSGDVRVALIVQEDRVHNTSDTTYAQHNYYAVGGAGHATPMANSEYNFNTLPGVIPTATMYYDLVGRGVFPSVNGAPGVLPATMTAGTSYPVTLTATLDPSWVQSKLNYTVILLNGANNEVLNSQTTLKPTGVANVSAGVNNLTIYPNPTRDEAHALITLDKAAKVTMQLVDVMGRQVATPTTQSMHAGDNSVTISTSALPTGIYYVKFTTEKGSVTERLSVIK